MQSNQECDVLVIGAGPTGLMAAYLLNHLGVNVKILDKNSEPAKESRAAIMSPRSLELFASLGLDGKLSKRGINTTEINFFVSGDVIGGVQYDKAHAPDTPFRHLLMIPQSATEEVLVEALSEKGIYVERNVEVTNFEQNEESVSVEAKSLNNPSYG
ncbi:FAD-dependent oxidoreductase [Acinetobacter towneri]|uniref:FAD-dependent oxidoreductase n=1 Tax=Acinetobacter towneri TaxID=202956 RepID=UPI0002CED580|nr:FAD-dependent monooxygenase [Acinetobacter towneri]ENV69682.1 hypothetical protein F947_01494 [Acinetobacter towneri DSM 14962 = CIP 107472]